MQARGPRQAAFQELQGPRGPGRAVFDPRHRCPDSILCTPDFCPESSDADWVFY